jgi:hypothetical protein
MTEKPIDINALRLTDSALKKFLATARLPALAPMSSQEIGEAFSSVSGGASSSRSFIRFNGKTGVYSVGRQKQPMDPDAVWLLEPMSMLTGWVCWKASKDVQRHSWATVRDRTDRISEDKLEDHGPYRDNLGEGWKVMRGFGAVECAPGGLQYEFSTTSLSGCNSVQDIQDSIRDRAIAGEHHVPLIHFRSEMFVAQDAKNYKPIFLPVAWIGRDEFSSYLSGDTKLEDLLNGKPSSPKKSK